MKDATYFSHDDNAASDPKVKAMMSRYGVEGYGRFWLIVEMLATADDNRLPLGGYIWNALAMHMQCTIEQAREYVECCISECQLFTSDGEYFWSESLNRRVERRRELAEKKRKAAEKRWSTQSGMQNDARALHPHARAMQSDAKERKGKSSKRERETQLKRKEEPDHDPNNPQIAPPELEAVITEGARIGQSRESCELFFAHYGSQSWMKGNNQPMTHWPLALRVWKANDAAKRKDAGNVIYPARPMTYDQAEHWAVTAKVPNWQSVCRRVKAPNGKSEWVKPVDFNKPLPPEYTEWEVAA